jgi:hypothetical protein
LHRVGAAVDLRFLLPEAVFARVNALAPERFLAILDDPMTYLHLYDSRAGAALEEHIDSAIAGSSSVLQEVRHGVSVACDVRLHMHSGSRLCPPDATYAPTPDQWGSAFAKLDRAYSTLAELSPCAHHFVLSMKRLLNLMSTSGTHFTYASNQLTVGALYFSNVHLERATPLKLVTSLVHEAIHDSLFILERSRPLVVEESPPERPHPVSMLCVDRGAAPARPSDIPTLRSPWTGRELPLSTWVHAVFVWFGLRNLLEIADRKGYFPEGERRYHLGRIVQGFRACPEGASKDVLKWISPEISLAVRNIFAEVNGRQ